jgi:hypothetical protein
MLRVISLGAGVQSTTMALLAAHGEIGPLPDCAIFADTGWEPRAVYEHLAWLMSADVLPFPVYTVSRGDLAARMFAGDDAARIPFFVGRGGMVQRQCTRNYKLRPIRRKVRELLGVGARGYVEPGAVEQWLGISTDEVIRVRGSGLSFIVNRHPLIEQRMSRHDCAAWLRRHDYPIPPKSACVFCPYHRNDQWRDLREHDPESWGKAVEVDRRLRTPENVARFRGELYAHNDCVPLDQVDLSTAEDRGQLNLFNNECEGMCGV